MTPLADAAAGMVETPEEVAVLADCASNIESADFLRSSHLLQRAQAASSLAATSLAAAASVERSRAQPYLHAERDNLCAALVHAGAHLAAALHAPRSNIALNVAWFDQMFEL